MDPTERSLLDAILASPDDDDPRLVYADWLEERGDEQSELIRAQIALANTSTTDEGWWELDRRVEALLERNTLAWTKRLPKPGKVAWGIQPAHFDRRDGFDRGLMERATFPNPSQFENTFDELWQHTPVRHVRINKWSEKGATQFFRPEVMDRIRGLWLTWDGFDSACTRVPGFFRLPHWERVETLRLFDRILRPDGLDALVDQTLPALGRLEFVSIQPYGMVYVDDLLGTLSEWPSLAGVRDLVVDDSAVGDAGIQALAASPYSANLERLSLETNLAGAEGLRALGESPYLERLGDLSVASLESEPDSLFGLVNTPLLSRLRRFDASGIRLDGEIALALVDGHRDWHELRLGTSCNDDVAAVLANAETLGELRALDVSDSNLGEAAIVDLATSTNLGSLSYIVLDAAELSAAALDEITDRFPYRHFNERRSMATEFATDPAYVP